MDSIKEHLKFNVVSWEGTDRLDYIKKLLKEKRVNYNITFGKKTFFGWDAHRDMCIDIVRNNQDKDYVIICEDDVIFTDYFNLETLDKYIQETKADVISTGSFSFENLSLKQDKIYSDKYNGNQLVIVMKSAYDAILNDTRKDLFFEDMLSSLGLKIEITFPFLSTQGGIFKSNISRIKSLRPMISETEEKIKEFINENS